MSELDPENVIALKSLAEISERAGRLPEAMRRLEMLLDVDRNNEEARGQLDRVRELGSLRRRWFIRRDRRATPRSRQEPVSGGSRRSPRLMEAVGALGAPGHMEPRSGTARFLEELSAASEPVEPPRRRTGSRNQLRNDSETLLPSDERLEDVVLSEDTELEVRDAAGDRAGSRVSMYRAPEMSSAMAIEPPPPPARR